MIFGRVGVALDSDRDQELIDLGSWSTTSQRAVYTHVHVYTQFGNCCASQ